MRMVINDCIYVIIFYDLSTVREGDVSVYYFVVNEAELNKV